MASHDIIYKIMNFLNIIVKSLKTTLHALKNNSSKISKILVTLGLLLLFKKVAMAKKYGGKVKIIEEGISSFYEKIKQNNIKSVDILSQSIVYKDLS